MKKIALCVFTVMAFVLYSWHARNEQSNAKVAAPTAQNSNSSQTNSGSSSSSNPSSSSTTTTSSSAYKDGTYTGSSADAVYGNIQIQAVISGGKITDVVFLSYPNDRSTSVQINQQAMPLLKQEAIQAQSSTIDGVTGATDSSQAFIQSLSSALQQAKV
jgi:uncharacterized protein with FMN-binding domain